MSSQKEKYLASAQKFIQKGQFDRALRDYEQVVTADPKDVKHRQKLAELMVRCNRKDDAIREYETIAKYYDENGFFLKAIAVYKQIQRLDPSNISISLCLATLNEKQGMIGNALSEYKVVFDYYEKSGALNEAIGVLQKMQAVDPENIDIKLKLAETLFAADQTDNAYNEFTKAVLTLRSRGNAAFADRVCRKIQELFPDRGDAGIEILAEQVKSGMHEEALPKLQQLLDTDPDNVNILVLVSEACRLSGDVAGRTDILKKILRLSPDDVAAKKSLVESAVAGGDVEESLELLHRYQGDLLAAGAYGEIEHCYTTLQNAAPYDVRLLEGLKNLYEHTGESSKLSDVQVSLNILSQRGSASPAETSANAGGAAAASHDVSWGDEIDLSSATTDVNVPPEKSAAAGPAEYGAEDLAGEEAFSDSGSQEGFGVDISFDVPDATESVAELVSSDISPLSGENTADSMTSGEGGSSSTWGDEIDLSAMDTLDIEVPGDMPASGPMEYGAVDLVPEPLADEQARPDDFEIDISFEFPDGADIFASGQQQSGDSYVASDVVSAGQESAVSGMDSTADSAIPEATVEESVDDDAFGFLQEEGPAEEPQDDAAVNEAASFIEPDISEATVEESVDDDAFDFLQEEGPAEELQVDAAVEEAPSFIEPVISLTEELSEESASLSSDESSSFFQSDEMGGSNKYTFDGQFAKFKEGLDQQVESGDTETHYNLGIAYMEMGLYDDAVKEFLSAGSDPNRKLDCLTLQGVCSREKGDFAAAERYVVSALSLDGLDADRVLNLRYELALLYEASGRKEEALQSFRDVFSVNPGFRDTMNKIAVLSGRKGSFDLSELDDVDIELETLE